MEKERESRGGSRVEREDASNLYGTTEGQREGCREGLFGQEDRVSSKARGACLPQMTDVVVNLVCVDSGVVVFIVEGNRRLEVESKGLGDF